MDRSTLVGCLAVLGALLHLSAIAGAPPKPEENPQPQNGSALDVIMKARPFEVDEAFHKELEQARWLSQADLEELETKPSDGPRFARLGNQTPFLAGKAINID